MRWRAKPFKTYKTTANYIPIFQYYCIRSFSQLMCNSINNVLCKKLKQWLLCLAHKLKHNSKAKDWLILNKIFKIRNGTLPLTTTDRGSHTNFHLATVSPIMWYCGDWWTTQPLESDSCMQMKQLACLIAADFSRLIRPLIQTWVLKKVTVTTRNIFRLHN